MKNVTEYLEESKNKYPNKIAVVDTETKLSYLELSNMSKAIATCIIEKVEQNNSVVFFGEKSANALASLLGIAYSGCFYTLLDSTFPENRIAQILGILDPKIILTEHIYDNQIDKLGVFKDKVVYLENIGNNISNDAIMKRESTLIDTLPLYCNFTSGSTGVPKGVLVSNRSVIDFIDTFTNTFNITNEDVIGNQAPFDFDVSVKDIYSSIKMGATLVILPKEYFMFPVKLIDMLDQYNVTTIIWAVSALCMLIRLHGFKYKVPKCISKIMFSGEVMPIKQLNKLKKYYPNALYVNLYGPTEITCNCTYHILNREYQVDEKLPIGIPFDNEKVFLLNDNIEVSNDNEIGEICVSGTTVALGYYKNPKMTSKSFVQNPLNTDYPEIIYKTGDLGYWQNGVLYFSGRKDFQIKHMGHRIELEEIEIILENINGVSHCCCIYDTRANKIIAFYSGNTDTNTILGIMKEQIPEYMVPNIFRQLDNLPLSNNGKTDRKLLTRNYNDGIY